MNIKRYFQVTLDVSSDVSIKEVKQFILDALQSEVGYRHPDDPMHMLNRKSIKVKSVTHQPKGV